jgi:hypothetical protein
MEGLKNPHERTQKVLPMEAERLNALSHRLQDLTQRVADLRRFL